MVDLLQMASALRPALRVRTVEGKPIQVGERQIVPVARSIALTIGRPGGPVAAGFVWNRPLAVLDTWRGQTRRIPIPDPTRRITLALAASGFVLALATRYLQQRQKMQARRFEL